MALGDEMEDDSDADDNDQRSSTSREPALSYVDIRKKTIEENKRLLQFVNDELSVSRPKTLTNILDPDEVNENVAKIISTFYG